MSVDKNGYKYVHDNKNNTISTTEYYEDYSNILIDVQFHKV